MATFADVEQCPRKLIKSTKFARVYSLDDKFAVKTITTDFIVAPHDHVAEKSILYRVKEGVDSLDNDNRNNVQYVMELLDDRRLEDEVELLFPFYPLSLYELMRTQYKRVAHDQPKKKFNPYYDLTSSADSAAPVPARIHYKNCFDVDRDAHAFFLQIAKGLEYIHACGIIHRDVKPQNVMVDPHTRQLKITDFGISYDTHSAQQTTKELPTHKITDVSTSFYKAPELLLSVKNYGFEVDVWALLVLVSQWFQSGRDLAARSGASASVTSQLRDDFYMPALVDDGSQDGEAGSDVRLLLCIFERFGVPRLADWPEVAHYGSEDAFVGLFGSDGDGKCIQYSTRAEQLTRLGSMLPRLDEVSDGPQRNRILTTLLAMTPFQASQRISSAAIVASLQS
ncbi:cyclin-dependent protein kinase-activating kinase [Maudiozyma humilis]|uniref:Cyclin-dependent protein kinase-activating kinase n=1 Tax=Maudiozyma humilis TaxID=51915 RepID=A0AAV5RR80_MAUHU|nr:cyclin-dependent protein kinase-activating kinase [Kazachstania humilis]